MDTLTDLQRAILELEATFYKTGEAKEHDIRAMGISPTRFYQVLSQLLGTESALAFDPVTVKRLRRIARI